MKTKMKTGKKVLIILGIFPALILIAIASIALIRSYNLGNPTEHYFTSVEDKDSPAVYMTRDISPESLIAIYEALGIKATGNVGVKLHMGEPGGHNFLSPDLIKELVQSLNGTIVENNIVGGMGQRGSTTLHMQIAKDHGFTAIAPVDILDADGEISIPVQNGKRLTEHLVGSHIDNYDFLVVLSHFKGHVAAGFGGAIKKSPLASHLQTGRR
jgi:uncharacterized Fe-S center protein